jgi:ligand-binding sensor domain-containing protein/signal transduction histidine kinase
MALPLRTVLGAGALVLLAAVAASGQYRVDTWTTENGLPQNSVHALLQTREGYLWLATFGGLVRFDGVAFTVFDAGGEAGGLRSVRIRALLEDRTGAIWIGTEHGGLTRYADRHFTTYTTRDGLPTDSVTFLHEDPRGVLWFATEAGLVRFADGRFRTFTTKDGLPDNAVTRMASDQHGALWIGTVHGLVRFVDGRFTTFTTRDGLPGNYVRSILVRRDGAVWIATANGLARVEGDRFITYTTADGLPTNALRVLHEDRAGHLWIGTNEGLARLIDDGATAGGGEGARDAAGHTFEAYTKHDGLSDNMVNSILDDREGDLWVGTNTGGLNRLKTRTLVAYGRAEGLPGDGVVPIAQDTHGDIWIGMTCGGLVRVHNGTFTAFTQKDGLPHECVWSLLPARDGSLWIGSWGGGLAHLTDGQFTTYTASKSGLSQDAVLALHEDRDGALWVGTASGLNRFANGTFRVYRRRDGLVDDEVRFITGDRQGAIWIGTSGGLSRFKDGTFTNYTTEQGLSSNFVRAIHETADGTLWIGTYGGGLNRFKDGRFTHYTTRDGLFEHVVSRILEDDRGDFWMTGNTGIFRVRRQELDDFADGKTSGITSVAYGVPDGMRSNECNGGGQPAGWKARDGTLWFPTARGVVTIDPRRVTPNAVPPPVVIEQILVDRRVQDRPASSSGSSSSTGGSTDSSIGNAAASSSGGGTDSVSAWGTDGGLDVPPGAGDLEIQYTGLSFAAPERVRFRYRLAGLDEHWIDAGTRRTAYYSHLPPGRYTFTVLASNGDGLWNGTGATLQVRIIPPFYRTRTFFILAAAALAALVLITYERRIRRLTRARLAQEDFSRRLIDSQEQERKRLAAELHDSLSQTLVVIKNRALLSLQTPDNPARALDQMDEIAEAATHAIDEVKEISYNLRPYHLDRLGLTQAIDAMIEKVSAADGVRFTTTLDRLDDLFPKDAEINIYRIVQECVTNVIKHAHASEASLTMRRSGRGGVSITIRDNGTGFTPDGSGALRPAQAGASAGPGSDGRRRGFGLISIAERARLFGGEPQIHSAPGQGTTIQMTLEVHAAHGARDTDSDRG